MGRYFTGLIYSKSDGKENYKAWSTVTTTALADCYLQLVLHCSGGHDWWDDRRQNYTGFTMFSIKLGKFSTQWYIVDLFGLLGSLQTGLVYLLDHTSRSYCSYFVRDIILRKSVTVANECMSATFLTCLLSYLPCNLSLWHERRHPAPAPGITSWHQLMTAGVTPGSAANQRPGSGPGDQ